MIIDGSDITDIIETVLNSSSSIEEGVSIESSGFMNDNPTYARNGWIGIYKNKVSYVPNTLGGANAEGVNIQWKFLGSFFTLIQYSSMKSGKVCNQKLESLVQQVILSIFNDPTFNGLIDMILNVNVDYSAVPRFQSSEGSEEVNFQQALVTFEVEVDRR